VTEISLANNLLNKFESNVNYAKASKPALSAVLDEALASVRRRFDEQGDAYREAARLRDEVNANDGRANAIYRAMYEAFPVHIRDRYTLETLLTPGGVNPPDVKAIVKEVVEHLQVIGRIDAATAMDLNRFRL
jgi:hypothetical protein